MITLKPVLKGKLHSLAFMVCVMLTLCVFLGGCSSMPKQTEQDKIDIVMDYPDAPDDFMALLDAEAFFKVVER